MGYVFAVMWLVIGVYLIYNGIKENKLFCLLGSYFIFFGFWWGINELVSEDLFNGVYGIVLRVVSAIALVIAVALYLLQRKRRKQKEEEDRTGKK